MQPFSLWLSCPYLDPSENGSSISINSGPHFAVQTESIDLVCRSSPSTRVIQMSSETCSGKVKLEENHCGRRLTSHFLHQSHRYQYWNRILIHRIHWRRLSYTATFEIDSSLLFLGLSIARSFSHADFTVSPHSFSQPIGSILLQRQTLRTLPGTI